MLMTFKHYSAKTKRALTIDDLTIYDKQKTEFKPQGLWLSEGNAWYIHQLSFAEPGEYYWVQDVIIDESKLYRLKTWQAIVNFTKKFGLDKSKFTCIKWDIVRKYLESRGKYGIFLSEQAIAFCNNDRSVKSKYMWGHMFDVPSMCTWNPKEMILSISKRKKAAKYNQL